MSELKKKKDKHCGKNEYIVHCKVCNIRHYQEQYQLQIFEVLGYYMCGICVEKMKGYILIDKKDLLKLINFFNDYYWLCASDGMVDVYNEDYTKVEKIKKKYNINIEELEVVRE